MFGILKVRENILQWIISRLSLSKLSPSIVQSSNSSRKFICNSAHIPWKSLIKSGKVREYEIDSDKKRTRKRATLNIDCFIMPLSSFILRRPSGVPTSLRYFSTLKDSIILLFKKISSQCQIFIKLVWKACFEFCNKSFLLFYPFHTDRHSR